MYKHRATMTGRRYKILKLIAKGYNNKQIARKLGLTLSNTAHQKWRLYCFLGDVHNVIDAVYMGLQKSLLKVEELSEAIREEIYVREIEKQMHSHNEAGKRNNWNIQTDSKTILFPAKRARTA